MRPPDLDCNIRRSRDESGIALSEYDVVYPVRMSLDLAAKSGSRCRVLRAGVPRRIFRRDKRVLGIFGIGLEVQIQVPGAYDTITAAGITGTRSAT